MCTSVHAKRSVCRKPKKNLAISNLDHNLSHTLHTAPNELSVPRHLNCRLTGRCIMATSFLLLLCSRILCSFLLTLLCPPLLLLPRFGGMQSPPASLHSVFSPLCRHQAHTEKSPRSQSSHEVHAVSIGKCMLHALSRLHPQIQKHRG